MKPNRRSYFASLGQELAVQANRVRDLIGDAHWLTDGHHKEYLLRALLTRHLPNGVLVGRGFVLNAHDEGVSREQDVLVVDVRRQRPLFAESDVLVVSPETVLAAASVKTNLTREATSDSVAGLCSVQSSCADLVDPARIWLGVYAFQAPHARETMLENIAQVVAATSRPKSTRFSSADPALYFPRVICAASNIFRFRRVAGESLLTGYECGELAGSTFLGHLVQHVCLQLGGNESSFFRDLDELDVGDAFGPPRTVPELRHPGLD